MRNRDALPAETTIISLEEAVPGANSIANRRTGERHLTLFRVGSFQLNGRRELCMIRNISAGGMMIRAYCELQPAVRLSIELKSGQPVNGTVSWVRPPYSGIAFDTPIDVIEILSSAEDGPRPRMPRVEAKCFATLRDGGIQHRARLSDISQGGAKFECPEQMKAGTPVVASIVGLDPIAGVVCWSDDDCVGISFNGLLPLAEMIEWLRSIRGTEARFN